MSSIVAEAIGISAFVGCSFRETLGGDCIDQAIPSWHFESDVAHTIADQLFFETALNSPMPKEDVEGASAAHGTDPSAAIDVATTIEAENIEDFKKNVFRGFVSFHRQVRPVKADIDGQHPCQASAQARKSSWQTALHVLLPAKSSELTVA